MSRYRVTATALVIAAVVAVCLLYAYVSFCPCKMPMWLGSKWGYIDRQGTLVVPLQFDVASDFHEGIARVGFVRLNRFSNCDGHVTSSAYIDKAGRYVIPPMNGLVGEIHDGLAVAYRKSLFSRKYGYMDRTGRFVIEPQFGYALDFSEGLAAVHVGDSDTGSWGFVDTSGRMVINPQFASVLFGFSEGMAVVSLSGNPHADGPYGYIDRTGKLLTTQNPPTDQPVTPGEEAPDSLSEGLAGVQDEDSTKWGFTDTNGNTVIQPTFDQIRQFKGGIAAVRVGNNWGFIDKTGRFVIAPKYQWVSDYSDGLAAVCTAERYIPGPPRYY